MVLDALSSKTSKNNLKRDIGVETHGKNLANNVDSKAKLYAQSLSEKKEAILLYPNTHLHTWSAECTDYDGLNVTGRLGSVLSTKKAHL